MRDSATKYLKVISGQEVKLSPKGITVQCSGGTVKIEVLKSGMVNLYAQNEIQIAVKGESNMDAGRIIKIQGGKTVDMGSVKGGSLNLDKSGKITIQGNEVHMN